MNFIIVYDPEGGIRQEWLFDPTDPSNIEAEALESAGGEQWETYDEWAEFLVRGSYRARRALLWVLLLRNDPNIGFDQVKFRGSEFNSGYAEDEPGKAQDATDESGTDLT